MSPWRRDAAACLLLPRHLAGSLLWGWGWQGSHHPNPIHHREETGTLVPAFSQLKGREGSSASLCPASSSSIKIHQQLPALCPHPLHPPAEGTRNSPSGEGTHSRGCPGLAVCGGMSLSLCCLTPKCQQQLQVLSTHQDAQATPIPSVGCWVGSLGGPEPPQSPVCVCLHRCLSRPSSLTLLHLLRNP